MSIRNDMIKKEVFIKQVELNNLLYEMNKFEKSASECDKKTKEYQDKYNEYLKRLEEIKIEEEIIDEVEIDVVKHKHNPYLKLKYWISEYTTSYKKILKPKYIGISKKLDINLDISNLDKLIIDLENKINDLHDEEKVNYVFNLDDVITKELIK